MNYIEKQIKTKKESEILEKQIIGTLGVNKNIGLALLSEIREHWFLNYNKLFLIIKKSIIENDEPLSGIQKAGLSSFFVDCMDYNLFTQTQTESVIEKLKNNWLKYKVHETLQRYSEKDIQEPDKEISNVWNDLSNLLEGNENEETDFEYLYKLFQEEEKEYKEKTESGKKLIGYSTGFTKLDDAIDGLRNGHLWIIGAYTSGGKTQCVLNIAYHLMLQNVKVSIYSLEMSKVDIFKRMIGIISEENGSYLLKGKLSEEVEQKKKNAINLIRESQMRVHTEKSELNEILMSMNLERQTKRADVYIIDYAQLINSGSDSLYDNMRKLSVKLQAFCRKYNVPVILVSQVSNENAKNMDTAMIGFKGAGDLGASADIAIELSSADEKYEKERKISSGEPILVRMSVKKNRHGKIFNTDLVFQPLTGRFYNEPKNEKEF